VEKRRRVEEGSGTGDGEREEVKAGEEKEAKVTVEPAPMERAVRDWLTELIFKEEEPETEMEAGVVKVPERLVVPLVIWREE
jgi:hypothetical protein